MENLTLLPLHEILLHNGFKINRVHSSRRNPVLENENEKVVITKKGDNYLYFNADGSNDRGNIINFCRNRGIDVKTLIENYHNGNTDDIEIPKYFFDNKEERPEYKQKYDSLSAYDPQKNQFFLNRGIYDSTIEPYKDCFKQDSYGNICLPHYKLIEVQINQKIITDIQICGYTQRLSYPLYKDKDGKPLEKPRKFFHHGNKCLEILNINKNSKEIKNMILGESIVDCLSFMQIFKENFNPKETILISTAGNFHIDGIKPTLNKIFEICPQVKITTCFDNDQKGINFGESIKEIILKKLNKPTHIFKPFSKDVNNDLKLRQITQLSELNYKNFQDYLDRQLLEYRLTFNTDKRRTILEKIRKINHLKPISQNFKDRFNEIPKHKAIRSL